MSGAKFAHPDDPRGLIWEAFRMDGLDDAACRTILLDWALGQPEGRADAAAIARLLERHADAPEHPMTAVLREGLAQAGVPARRGGPRGRRGRA